MKSKRKSPKQLRAKRWGIITLGNPFVAAGTLTFSGGLVDDDAAIFTFNYDTGLQAGDYIKIVDNGESVGIDHRKVHVARRRQSKGKTKRLVYQIENATATCITVKADKGTTITYA